MKVSEIMTRTVITVAPQTPIREAASLMVDHGVSGLPVVDEQGRLVLRLLMSTFFSQTSRKS